MNEKQIMQKLKTMGTEQNRKVYRRHGVGADFYGVSFADLRQLGKQIKTDHALALALWKTDNHDAHMLATMIADPQAMDADTLDKWVKDLDNYIIADSFASLVAKTPFASKKMLKWNKSKDEWVGRVGWHLLAQFAMHDPALPDDYFMPYLDEIEDGIHRRKNRVREAMNNALMAMGIRNERLRERAFAVAKTIGAVEVDHGDTNCKTPDATAYIHKAVAYRQKKQTVA